VKTDNSALANCLFSATINGMIMRFYYITGTFVIGLIVIVSFCLFHGSALMMPEDERLSEDEEMSNGEGLSEEWFKKHGSPFISDFLGLSFPGQYAPPYGHVNSLRDTSYELTEEDMERAVKKIQDTFQNTQKVSVEFYADSWSNPRLVKEELLCYDYDLVAELCKQASLMQKSIIPPMSVSGTGPSITYILHPSGVKFNIMPDGGTCYVTLRHKYPRWDEVQRWRGDLWRIGIVLLDARLQDGETVRSTAARVLDKSDWYPKEHTPENGNSEDQTDSE